MLSACIYSWFANLPFPSGKGGLKYPGERLASKMWTIFLFFRRIFPQIRTTTKIVDDLVEFTVPHLSQCEEVRCSGDGKHRTFLCTLLCKKKCLGVLRTQEKKFVFNLRKNLWLTINQKKGRSWNFKSNNNCFCYLMKILTGFKR